MSMHHSNFNKSHLNNGISIRPARTTDKVFLETLYHASRDDLRLADAETEFIDELIGLQFNAQQSGYGEMFPDAMYFVIEKQQEKIGRISVQFAQDVIKLIDIAFIPKARGQGFGAVVIGALQAAAQNVRTPLVLHVHPLNFAAKQLYHKMGFRIDQSNAINERMVWYPADLIATASG